MIPSLEGWPTKAKEAPSPHEVRLAPLDTNPVFHSLGERGMPRGILRLKYTIQGIEGIILQSSKLSTISRFLKYC